MTVHDGLGREHWGTVHFGTTHDAIHKGSDCLWGGDSTDRGRGDYDRGGEFSPRAVAAGSQGLPQGRYQLLSYER